MSQSRAHLSLTEAAELLLEECRMVLPGIQALFGFQLVVVFQAAFWDRLSGGERHLHLAAIALVALAVALIMTPAARHRAAGARAITERFIRRPRAWCSRAWARSPPACAWSST